MGLLKKVLNMGEIGASFIIQKSLIDILNSNGSCFSGK